MFGYLCWRNPNQSSCPNRQDASAFRSCFTPSPQPATKDRRAARSLYRSQPRSVSRRYLKTLETHTNYEARRPTRLRTTVQPATSQSEALASATAAHQTSTMFRIPRTMESEEMKPSSSKGHRPEERDGFQLGNMEGNSLTTNGRCVS